MCATLEGLELIKLQAIESNKRLVFPVIYNSLCLSRDLILNDLKTIHATLVSIEFVFSLNRSSQYPSSIIAIPIKTTKEYMPLKSGDVNLFVCLLFAVWLHSNQKPNPTHRSSS